LKFRTEVIVPEALRNVLAGRCVSDRTGTEIPVWQTMVATATGPGAELLTSILRDLREQKTVESRLRESEAALRALNSQLQDRAAVCAAWHTI